MCIIAAPEGLKRLRKDHPDIQIYIGHMDRELNGQALHLPRSRRCRRSDFRNEVSTRYKMQKKGNLPLWNTPKIPPKDNVILIGMPGVGKSTAGVILAKVLGYDFLDSDLVIQKQTKKRLSEIIAAEGIDGFNTLENRINSEITVSHPRSSPPAAA